MKRYPDPESGGFHLCQNRRPSECATLDPRKLQEP
jgi:hypothetical protein